MARLDMDLTVLLTDDDLRRRFGTATCERAAGYVRGGNVRSCRHQVDEDGDLDIRGQVEGSRRTPYDAYVSAGIDGDGVWITSRCDCPMVADCKHVVALLMTVRAEQERDHGSAGGGDRRWERRLSHVLDELDDAVGRASDRSGCKPLALQFEVPPRSSRRHFWEASPSTRRTLRIRPVQRGARDNWIKTGVSFQDLSGFRRSSRYDPAQVEVLNELATAALAAVRYGYYGGPEPYLTMSHLGGNVWPILARVAEAGLPLVAGPGLDDVRVLPDPVTLELDVNGVVGGSSHLRLGVRAAEQWYDADAIDVLGDAGHGVVLWSPGSGRDRWEVTLAPLSSPAGPQLRQLLGAGDIVVPAAGRDDLVADYLPRLQRHVPVVSSDGSVVLPDPPTPRLALTVTWVAVDEVAIEWTWRYQVGGDDRVYGLSETRGMRGVRRPDVEQEIVAGLGLSEDQAFRLCDSHRLERGLVPSRRFTHGEAIGFAEDLLPAFEELAAQGRLEIEEIGGRPDYREARTAPLVRFAAREPVGEQPAPPRTDWLDLEVVITVEGQHLALARLLEALTLGQDRIIMPNGIHVEVDRPEFAHLAQLVTAAAELHDQPSDGVRVGHHDFGLWQELADVGIVDEQASQWVRAAAALRGFDTLPQVEPVGLKAELRHYQVDGFRWLAFLWQAGLGGILADDMGLGKTLQTLALVAHARETGAGPFLVVAPTSVVSTWAHEAASFTPGLVVRTVTESQSRRGASIADVAEGADVVVTSYTLLRLEIDGYLHRQWGGLVLDEAQTVKNHNAKTYQCVRRVDAGFRVALTGTPMENRLMELWSLLSIVAPGLYAHPGRFKELVANPVEREGDSAALDRFRRRIRPFLLRRTKDLVAADLPPKQEQVLEVQLTPRHRRIYETHLQRERQTVLGLVGDFERHRIAIFRSLTRLRQLSLDAGLVDPAYDGVGAAKLDVLADHLAEVVAEGHRALVFSQFTSFLSRVRARLDQEGLTSTYLDGRTWRRGEVIDGFKRGSASVFLISLKAGGVGLTLTEADYVFVLDPWWNPAVEAQAVDRAHRIGQRRPVMVYRLVSAETIEEKVMDLKARKAALFAKVLDGAGAPGTPIDADDVRALFED
jgi:superfamily II DNA or RNA helicase